MTQCSQIPGQTNDLKRKLAFLSDAEHAATGVSVSSFSYVLS